MTTTAAPSAQAPQKESLFYTDGKSDKEYHAQLVDSGAGYVVNFQYGRRGGTLTSGTKTKSPVSFDAAKLVFDKLILEKKQKGYTSDTSGQVFSGNLAGSQEFTGVLPQLLNSVDQEQAHRLMDDDNWLAQEKYDGVRRIMTCTAEGELGSINRKGLSVGMPQETAQALEALREYAPFQLDGELVGSTFYVFDALEWAGKDERSLPTSERLQRMQSVASAVTSPLVVVAPCARTSAEKTALVASLKERRAEGVVFKKVVAAYTPGRPNSGGDQLKWKFVKTATFIVRAQKDSKRSVELGLVDAPRSLGFVTIPANYGIPAVGALVEVEYLYAYPQGALAQPVYRGERDDLDESACVEKQLQFKANEDTQETT